MAGGAITTIEGFSGTVWGRALSASFLHHGAAQCGICTPGMVMAAAELLAQTPAPDEAAVEARLFATDVPAARGRAAPRWATIHGELKRKGVTLRPAES